MPRQLRVQYPGAMHQVRPVCPRVNRMTGLLLAVAVLGYGRGGQCADVVVDPQQTFQTIVGWGHGGGFCNGITGIAGNTLDPAVVDAINYQYFDCLADDLGLTGSRTWEVGPRIDGTGMDHGDCDVIDWSLFESDTLPLKRGQPITWFVSWAGKLIGRVASIGHTPQTAG